MALESGSTSGTGTSGTGTAGADLPVPGWYEDPQDPGLLRYWRGDSWTHDTRPMVDVRPAEPKAAATAATTTAAAAATATAVAAAEGRSPDQHSQAEAQAPGRSSEGEQELILTGADAVAGSGGAAAAVDEAGQHRSDASGAVIVATTDNLPGHRVTQVLGDVCGVCVRRPTASESQAEGASLDARAQAVSRMADVAARSGAEAVIGLRYDSVGGERIEVVAYGTAVRIVAE